PCRSRCLPRVLPTPYLSFFSLPTRRPPRSPLFPYTTLFRSDRAARFIAARDRGDRTFGGQRHRALPEPERYRVLVELLPWLRSRSEEHTSELQSLTNLVCRLLLEKKNKHQFTSDLPAISDSV